VPSQSNASVFISSLTLKAATGQTANLIVENNTAPSAGYGSLTQTALRTADGLILQPFLGTNTNIVQQTTTSELHLTSLELRTNTSSTVYGHEDWSLCLDTDETKGYGFVWSVNRTFAIDTHVVTDRQALVFSTIKYGAQTHGILGSQVPSVLDLNMVMNNTNTNNNAPGCLTTPTKPGTCGPSGFPSVNVGYPFNYQFVSPNLSQHVLLTPSGLEIDIDYSTNNSSTPKASFYEKKTADGTSPFVTLGASTTSWLDTEPTVVRSAGSNHSTTLTLRITKVQSSGSPYSSLNISFPKHLTSLEHSIQTFVRVQHQWMGWIFGNNPASTPCLHEMSWFGLIQQMFDVGSISHKAIAKEMDLFKHRGKWVRLCLPTLEFRRLLQRCLGTPDRPKPTFRSCHAQCCFHHRELHVVTFRGEKSGLGESIYVGPRFEQYQRKDTKRGPRCCLPRHLYYHLFRTV
jgi:hypothetical protein